MPGVISTPPGPARPAGAYAEHAPQAGLAPHVECFWSRTAPAEFTRAAPTHRVLPDGCADIVLGFDARSGQPAVALAVGTMTRPLLFDEAEGTSYLGVRFRPGVARVVLGVPASELTDERVPLADLWPETEELCATLAGAVDATARVRALSAAIARRLLTAPAKPPRVVVAAAERIVAARGRVSIADLTTELGVTRQHLARSFAEHVGISPKMLARIARARGAVARARGGGKLDWTSVALEAGYYDQSHLIAELKELTGLPPSAWSAARA